MFELLFADILTRMGWNLFQRYFSPIMKNLLLCKNSRVSRLWRLNFFILFSFSFSSMDGGYSTLTINGIASLDGDSFYNTNVSHL